MRLRRFRIRAFRSIRDSDDVPVGDIAALVGKNETGKTAILEGLTHLNSDKPIDELDICDELGDSVSNETVIVEGTFELSDAEAKRFKESPSMPEIKEITIRRKKDNTLEYAFNPPLSSDKILNKDEWKQLAAAVLQLIPNAPQEILEYWKSEETDPKTLEGMLTKTENFLSSQNNPQALQEFKKTRGAAVVVFLQDLLTIAKGIAATIHPRLVYFSDYRKLMGGVQLEEYLKGPGVQMKERLDSGEPLDKRDTIDNLFFLAKLDPRKVDQNKGKPAQLTKLLNDGGRHLTEELNVYWKGNPKQIDLDLMPNSIFTVHVSDINPDGSTSNRGLLNRHSEGFKWYFSFLVNFKAETKKRELKEAILLLDEPGMHLHPSQQQDIVELLRVLSKGNQIVYSTHSPFMLFDYKIGSILVVQVDPLTHLSKVEPRYWMADAETIRPVIAMLGGGQLLENISKTKRPVLILEGPTDYQYLVAMQDSLSQNDYHQTSAIQFVPSYGMSYVLPLALFHKERGYNTYILLDNHPDARKLSEEIGKSGFEQSRIMFVTVDSKKEADIEDLFTENDYLSAVNSVYTTTLHDTNFIAVTKDDIKKKSDQIQTVRVAKILEAIFRDHSGDGWGTFDKMKVCRKLCEDIANKKPGKETQERFGIMFDHVEKQIGQVVVPIKPVSQPVDSNASK